jgi:hypothetical protein
MWMPDVNILIYASGESKRNGHFHMKTEALLLAGLMVVLAGPCQAKSRPPLFADPRFDSMVIDGFDLYAVNPNRTERIEAWMLESGLDGAIEGLSLKGYNKWRMFTFYVPQIMPSEEMLSKPTPQWLQDLGDHQVDRWHTKKRGQTHRWIMIISIDDVPTDANLIKGTMSSSLYVYDRGDATLLWHDRVERRVNVGVLGNIIEPKGRIKNYEAHTMAAEMAAKLPKRKKR